MAEQTPLPYTLVAGSLTVVLANGESKTIQQSDDRKIFDLVIEAIKEGRWNEVPDLICPKQRIATFSDGNIVVVDGAIQIKGKKIPGSLSERIIDYSSQDLPYEPLVKFWENLNQNPSMRVVARLYGFLEANKHPITPDGCFIGYRGVREDFKDVHSGTMDNSPGSIVRMDRNEVDESENACSHGLHVANYEFAKGFGPVCIMVKVHPKDVVAVPQAYGTSKMRVCQFEVLQQVNEGSTAPLHDDGSQLETSSHPQIPMADHDQLDEGDEDEDEDDGDDNGNDY